MPFFGLESWRCQTTPDNISDVYRPQRVQWCQVAKLLLSLAVVLSASAAWAKPAQVVAPAGPGQRFLAVGVFDGSSVRARLCPSHQCDAAGGAAVEIPREAQGLLASATLELVNLGRGRHVVHLLSEDAAKGRAYEIVVSAPPAGDDPLLLFNGFTGLVNGEFGAREGPMVFVSELTNTGERRVVIGKQYETISLCGRPSVLAPQLVNPKDLKLYPAKVQRLSPKERDQAPRLKATRLDAPAKMGPPVLRAVGASSGVGAPQNLSDGDLATTWAENRGSEGRGEFVAFNAPSALPIAGFDFVVRPPATEAEASSSPGAAVREFWLATDKQLFHVAMPNDAWQAPGALYRVMLGEPVKTGCVALVVESSYGKGREQQVTFAELSAVSEFDPADIEGLVGALAGGGKRAEAAKTLLMSGGPAAFRAVGESYRKLDEGGRRVALDVMDQAGCELATPTYVRALLSRYKAHAVHGKERIRRCGRKSADHLVKTLRRARPRAWPILANELGLVAPDLAVAEIAPLLEDGSKQRRRLLRVAFARAASDEQAQKEVARLLADESLPDRARLDVLRSLGSAAAVFGAPAAQAFSRLLQKTDFRTKFLLLKPAAALSKTHAPAREYLSQALLGDKDPHIRLGAASAVASVPSFSNELMGATRDSSVRVRQAAVIALGKKRVKNAEPMFVERLRSDKWPMVRSVAAEALGELGASPTADAALGAALADAAPMVRARVVEALGRRNVHKFAGALRGHLGDKKEDPQVRRAAALALGRLCDVASLDLLTELSVKRSDPMLDQSQRGLALAALEALAALGPSDLRDRLAPLLSAEAAPGAREAAERALARAPRCAKR